eukprot:gene215-388_t
MSSVIAASHVVAGMLNAYYDDADRLTDRTVGWKRIRDGEETRCAVELYVNSTLERTAQHFAVLLCDAKAIRAFARILHRDASDRAIAAHVRVNKSRPTVLRLELESADTSAATLATELRRCVLTTRGERVRRMHDAVDSCLRETLLSHASVVHVLLPLHIASTLGVDAVAWQRHLISRSFEVALIRPDHMHGDFILTVPVLGAFDESGEISLVTECIQMHVRFDRVRQFWIHDFVSASRRASVAASIVSDLIAEQVRRVLRIQTASKPPRRIVRGNHKSGYLWYLDTVSKGVGCKEAAVRDDRSASGVAKLIGDCLLPSTCDTFLRLQGSDDCLDTRCDRSVSRAPCIKTAATDVLNPSVLYGQYRNMLKQQFKGFSATTGHEMDHSIHGTGKSLTRMLRAVRLLDASTRLTAVYHGHTRVDPEEGRRRACQPVLVTMHIDRVQTFTDAVSLSSIIGRKIATRPWYAHDCDSHSEAITIYSQKQMSVARDVRSCRNNRMVWYVATHDSPKLQVLLTPVGVEMTTARASCAHTYNRLCDAKLWPQNSMAHAECIAEGDKPAFKHHAKTAANEYRSRPGDASDPETQIRAYELLEHCRLDMAVAICENVFNIPVHVVDGGLAETVQRRCRWYAHTNGIGVRKAFRGDGGVMWQLAMNNVACTKPALRPTVADFEKCPPHAYLSMHESLYHAVRICAVRWPGVCTQPPDLDHLHAADEAERNSDFQCLRSGMVDTVPVERLRKYKTAHANLESAADSVWVYSRVCVYPAREHLTDEMHTSRGRCGTVRMHACSLRWYRRSCGAPEVRIVPHQKDQQCIPGLRVSVDDAPHDQVANGTGYDVPGNIDQGRIVSDEGGFLLTNVALDALVTARCELKNVVVHLLLVP